MTLSVVHATSSGFRCDVCNEPTGNGEEGVILVAGGKSTQVAYDLHPRCAKLLGDQLADAARRTTSATQRASPEQQA